MYTLLWVECLLQRLVDVAEISYANYNISQPLPVGNSSHVRQTCSLFFSSVYTLASVLKLVVKSDGYFS